MRIYIFLFLVVLSVRLSSQQELMKAPYTVIGSEPEWVKEMYQEKPNVQLVDQLYKEYYKHESFRKSIHTQNYKHWRREVEQYLTSDGTVFIPDVKQINESQAKVLSKKETANRSESSWSLIGPNKTLSINDNQVAVSWQGNVYSIDQSVSDPNVLYVGAEAGGVFKSSDKGLNWTNASFNSTMRSMTTVKIHPQNPDIVYAGNGQNLYKTTNGGDDWSIMLAQNGLGANDILIKPTDPEVVFVASVNGLYRSEDGGENWSQLLSSRIWDIEYKPDNAETIYVLRSNDQQIRTELWKSTNGGDDFELKDNGWYSSDNPDRSNGGARMTVTPADPNRIYTILIGQSKPGDSGYIGVYRSDDAGESWVLTDPPIGGPYDNTHYNLATITNTNTYQQGYYNLGIAASHENADHFLVGCLNLWRSTDAGASFQPLGGYQGSVSWIHPDQQEIEINGGDYWLVNDGGINYSTDMFETHESRVNGMYSSDFWGFGSGWNEDLVVGGRYHNGNTAYRPSFEDGQFMRLGGAEAATGYVQPGGESIAFFSDIAAKKIPFALDAQVENRANPSMFPSESFYAAHYSELEFDANCYGHIYIGRANKLYKSEDNGGSFIEIGSFGQEDQPIMQFEVNRTDNQVIYAYQRTSFYGATLWFTDNGGETWTQRIFPQGVSSMRAGALANHATNPGTLWVAFAHQNNDGNKLFRTDDYGQSWTNVTDNILDGESISAIIHHIGTEDDLYIGTNFSVYRMSGGVTELCSNGLPARVSVNRFAPFYRDNKLRVATYGNGVWEMNFVEQGQTLLQATVDKLSSNCSRDTFYFDDYSVLNHDEMTTWEWRFSSEPEFVSDKNSRTPKVVFGAIGSYDVSMTVTTEDGPIEFTKSNMITIDQDLCRPDGLPGNAFSSNGSGVDYIQLGNIGKTLESFTITAWIKPNGSQPDYSGIVFNDDASTGINMIPGNKLGFHYQDQGSAAWAWDSGLAPNQNEWNFVAMVANDEGVRIYLNDDSSLRPLNLEPTTLGTMKIGSYKGWGSRNFNGEIDEVCIWGRALTEEEIRNQRHITKTEGQQGLLHYYQFNESDGLALDKISSIHGTFNGLSQRVPSDAPVGSGYAETRYVDDTNRIDISSWSEELNLKLEAAGPLGEAMTISQINLSPSNQSIDNLFPQTRYWIINGFNNTNINRIIIEGEGLEPYFEDRAEEILIYNRPSNSGLETEWVERGTASSANAATDIIDFSLGVLPGSQVVLSKALISSAGEVNELASQIFPNPVNDILNIEAKESNITFYLYDSKGQQILEKNLSTMSAQIKVSDDIQSGLYHYVIIGAKKMKTGKLIIQK